MGAIGSFRELRVYQLAVEQARVVFVVSQGFPKGEQYSLTDQIRRSSRAVGAMIAESWGRRRYRAAFVDKLSQALAETMETQAWLDHARASGYIAADQHEELDGAWQHVGAMLNRMIQRADDFCTTPREQPTPLP